MDIEEFFDILCGDFKFEEPELKVLHEIVNNAIKVASKVSTPVTRKDYTLAISIVFNYFIIPKDILYKLDKKTYIKYVSAVNYLIKYINNVTSLNTKGIEALVVEYNKAHSKSLDEMSKEELLAYIKEHKID